jgi:hypothetical protein
MTRQPSIKPQHCVLRSEAVVPIGGRSASLVDKRSYLERRCY